MQPWRITRLRGEFALTFDQHGKRRRFTLNTADPREAQRLAPALYAELTRPSGTLISDLWAAYCLDKAGKSITTTMGYTGKAILPHFGHRHGEDVTKAECDAYTALRKKQKRSDGTIHTELGHLRTVLVWAVKKRLIAFAPEISRPAKPEPKDRHLSRDEAKRLIAAATQPHVKLAMHLMLATAARITAILQLTWDRVDFERKLIYLRDPDDKARRKGRATVPINKTLMKALREAHGGALSDYVVEWAGEPVKSIKRSVSTAARLAKIGDVSPHVFRHTAAVWMAEGGVPMSEISQYLGHTNLSMTVKVYARFSPDHLRKASEMLELDDYEVPAVTREPDDENIGET